MSVALFQVLIYTLPNNVENGDEGGPYNLTIQQTRTSIYSQQNCILSGYF